MKCSSLAFQNLKALFIAAALFFIGWLIRCLLKLRKSPTVEQIVKRLRTADS